MAKTTHYFTGPCQWAKVYQPDDKFGEAKYSIDILLDMDQYTKFASLKLKNGGTPVDGKMKVTLRRKAADGPPTIVDSKGDPFTESIGNGSTVTCKLEVESFVSKKYGNVTKSTLVAVKVDNFVKYEKESTVTETPTPAGSPTPRIPF